MKNQIRVLKVKIKSLAEEARIIRLEERRVLGFKKPDPQLYFELRTHRINTVRSEQRSALLAYAYLRGREYRQVERMKMKPHKRTYPDQLRVWQLIEKFGGTPYQSLKIDKAVVAAWLVKGSAVVE